jgi:hypothetical protein
MKMAKFNVNFSQSTYEALTDMSKRLDQPMAEVIREALSIYGWLLREASAGSTFLIQRGDRAPSELVIPYLERLKEPTSLSAAAPAAARDEGEARPVRRRRSERPTGAGRRLPT